MNAPVLTWSISKTGIFVILFFSSSSINSDVISSPASAYTKPVFILTMSSAMNCPIISSTENRTFFNPPSSNLLIKRGVILVPDSTATSPVSAFIRSALILTPLY